MSRAALVVIDVQESFRQRPIWAAGSNPDIAARSNRLVGAARAAATWWSGSCTPSRAPAACSTRPSATSG